MMSPPVHRASGIEWSVVSQPLPGQAVSGDQYVVTSAGDIVLLAVIDGLGHGDEATLAARRAADVLVERARESVVALVEHCHRALRDTRGAAMTVVALDRRARTATALGVGNVETVLVRADRTSRPARQSVLLRNGVVGYRLPPLQMEVHSIGPGDVVVFATDGVREDFADQLNAAQPLPDLVERIVAQKFRGTDDALVLACKVLDDDEG